MFFKIKKLSLLFLFSFLFPNIVLGENLKVTNFGHSHLLIKGGGKSIILNPFKATGCASDLEVKKHSNIDFILASSRLADEGYNPSNKLMFVDPGTYQIKKTTLIGIPVPHDRMGGRRYGMATVWTWNQNDLKIVHMAGAAGQINMQDQILLSHPDVLFISIGGGDKSYTGKEAAQIVNKLKPKTIIPVHFKQGKKLPEKCDFSTSDLFIQNVSNYKVKYVGQSFQLNSKQYNQKIILIKR